VTLTERWRALEETVSERTIAHTDWLRDPLLATPAACAKAAAYFRRTPAPWTGPDVEHVLTSLVFHGDRALHHVVSRLIAELPPAVSDYLIRRVAFLGVGYEVGGWCGPVRMDRVDTMAFLVVLSAGSNRTRAQIRAIAIHEIAHAWLMPEPAADAVCGSSFWRDTLLDEPLERYGLADDVRQAVEERRAFNARDERQARELVSFLGFSDLEDACLRAAREGDQYG
jgi:hypothetical protein